MLENEAKKLLEKAEPLGLVIDFDIKHIRNLTEKTKLESANKDLLLDKAIKLNK
jgi:hypothetical protein